MTKILLIISILLIQFNLEASDAISNRLLLLCKDNDATACLKLGMGYHYGVSGVKIDAKEAIKYYKKSCDNPTRKQRSNSFSACNFLGKIYYNGELVRQDRSKAKHYYGLACDGGIKEGCKQYRVLNELGIK